MTDVNATVITIGRTPPVPKGQQTMENSLPVVVASDQTAVPVTIENQQVTEVSLSLLGIPRSEVALGIFSDVTTYAINPNEWQSTGGGATTHLASESAAKVAVPNGTTNNYQKLSSKRFFRYQPGRVSSATFGVKYSTSTTATDVKKAGAFDDRDGYYLEVLGGAQTYGAGDLRQDKNYNFLAVRRSSAFETAASGIRIPDTSDGDIGVAGTDLVLTRGGLTYVHAALYDRSLREATTAINIGSNASSDGTTSVSSSFLTVASGARYTYEYRVPRRYFTGDKLDATTSTLYYADRTPGKSSFTLHASGTADVPLVSYVDGDAVLDSDGNVRTDTSSWDFDFSKVTMLKMDYSWYGAVGARFFAYVPDTANPGDARWVRVHDIRTSNQLAGPSLSNPTLPITYVAQKSTGTSDCAVYKYGASYYIDGGDKGTIVSRSENNELDRSVTTAGEALLAIRVKEEINSVRNRMQVYPTRLGVGTSDRATVQLIKNPIVVSSYPTFTSAGSLSPVEYADIPSGTTTTLSGGTTVATFFVGAGGVDLDLSPYFAYNKDYMSFPLTAASGDALYVYAKSASSTVNISSALTWEEQI
jgi:hypothetical protein